VTAAAAAPADAGGRRPRWASATASGVLAGQAGDDVAEERVGEAADAVDAVGGGGGGGGDGRLGGAAADVGQEQLRVPDQLVRAACGRRRGARDEERRPGGHGRRRRQGRRRGFREARV